MNTKIIAATIGALLLGGTTLVNAGPLDDLFRLLPHPGLHLEHRGDDHGPRNAWHREDRGFARHEAYRWERRHRHPGPEHRFEAHRDFDRGDHRGFGPHGHQR